MEYQWPGVFNKMERLWQKIIKVEIGWEPYME